MLGLTKRATDTEIKKVRRSFEPTAESTVGPLRIPKLLWPVTLVRRTVRWRLCTIPTATRRLMTRRRRRRRSSSRSSARSAADCHRRNHSPTYSFALSLSCWLTGVRDPVEPEEEAAVRRGRRDRRDQRLGRRRMRRDGPDGHLPDVRGHGRHAGREGRRHAARL